MTSNIFISGFWGLSTVCMGLFMYTRKTIPTSSDAKFISFQRSYVLVYLLATASDWMQGPYVYALYEHYNMTTRDIEILFVAGYGSSMIFGTIVGSFADKYGRRTNCILYALLYGAACFTKHSSDFRTLFVGRLCSGVATSILCSAFESWVICEHHKRGFEDDLLSSIFSHAVLGNSLVAILSGVVSQLTVDKFGYVAPFDLAICLLVIMVLVILWTWVENYGDEEVNCLRSFDTAFNSIKSDGKILCLGLIQSLFEASMYTFVLEWTPALTPGPHTHYNDDVVTSGRQDDELMTRRSLSTSHDGVGEDAEGEGVHRGAIPHGYIFASFMVAIMTGSSIFKILTKHSTVESFLRYVLLTSAVALLIPILFHESQSLVFMSFLLFEICVGIFWPSLSTMRGKYVPEHSRATVMNLFRVPLNLIVVIILTQNFSMSVIFNCCVVFLLLATTCQHILYS